MPRITYELLYSITEYVKKSSGLDMYILIDFPSDISNYEMSKEYAFGYCFCHNDGEEYCYKQIGIFIVSSIMYTFSQEYILNKYRYIAISFTFHVNSLSCHFRLFNKKIKTNC